MTDRGRNPRFGGSWTKKKLDILGKHLNAYTTARKKKPFTLLYIDAFAGTGRIKQDFRDDPVFQANRQSLVMGSAERALNVTDRPFDHLVFVERDPNRCGQLRHVESEYAGRSIDIVEADANDHLGSLRRNENRNSWRGVLF